MAADSPARGEPEPEAGGTDILGAEEGGTDVLGDEGGGTDVLGRGSS